MATVRQLEHSKADLYQQGFFTQINVQVQTFLERQSAALNLGNLLEEVERPGKDERQELKSLL